MSDESRVELDYAFPAQWARVNNDGTLTVVDASFLAVAAPLGGHMPFAVAARIRFVGGIAECDLRIDMTTPSGSMLSFTGSVDASLAQTYGGNRRHMLVALNSALVVDRHGQVKIEIFLDDISVHTLMFEVVAPLSSTG